MKHSVFPDYVCERDVYSAVGKSMDMYTLRSIGKHLNEYLHGNMQRDHCHAMTAHERHRSLGCAPPQITKKLEYTPYNKPCPACPLGKSRRARSSTTLIPKGSVPLEVCYMDQKISSVPDRNGYTRMLVIVDSCTNDSWVFPLKDGITETIISTLDTWRVQRLRNKPVQQTVMDNDPSFTSEGAQKYFNDAKIVAQTSGAYRQMLWARLNPTATIHIQTAPSLGDAYWTDNEQFRRRPSRANANYGIPYELSTGKKN